MPTRAVVLDACTLVPIRTATTLLWLAEAGMFHPLWSEPILDEVERALPTAAGIDRDRAAQRVTAMRDGFGSESTVTGFEHLVPSMTCDPKDRHVLAAAVHGHADGLVTINLRDFPDRATEPHGIRAQHPDDFLQELLVNEGDMLLGTIEEAVATLTRPALTTEAFLTSLAPVVPGFSRSSLRSLASRQH